MQQDPNAHRADDNTRPEASWSKDISDEIKSASTRTVNLIEHAWSLLTDDERLVLARRFSGTRRTSGRHREALRPSDVGSALSTLRDLMARAGIQWRDAFVALRECDLDLGLRELVRPLSNEAHTLAAVRQREEKRREEGAS